MSASVQAASKEDKRIADTIRSFFMSRYDLSFVGLRLLDINDETDDDICEIPGGEEEIEGRPGKDASQ